MNIEAYSFGRIVVNGQEHRSDLVLYPDGRIQTGWWRNKGHELCLSDVLPLVEARPAVVVVGTGAAGMMRLDPAFEKELSQQGIRCEAAPTDEAIRRYNALAQQGVRVGACFHLTC